MDPSNAAVPNAMVTATNLETGQVRTATTGQDGAYKFGLLPPGDYRVKFEAAGFQALEVPSATVNVTETAVLDRTLQVGAQNQLVTVEGSVETIQTTSSTLGTVIASRTVTDLPLNTRNYTNLLSLSAGTNAGVQNASAIGKGSAATSVNGASNTQNNYEQDGVSVNNWNSTLGMAGGEGGSTGFIAIPNPDAISEFKIQTSTYDASFGRNPGAAVNVVTKSGSNDFHGTAFEFLRNTALNANDWFLNRAGQPRGVLNQNQFGGSLGGRIKKGKLLFFVSYQETRQKNSIAAGSLSNAILPVIPAGDRSSAAWLDALYSKYCNTSGVQTVGTGAAAQSGVLIQAPSSGVCPNPLPKNASASTATKPINPVALNILRLKFPNGSYYIPSSGNGVTAIPFNSPAYYTEHQPIINLDYIINDKHTLSSRYFYSIDPQDIPFPAGGTVLPGFPNHRQWTNETALVKLTSVLSNNFVNEARASYQRYITNSTGTPPFTDTQVGISTLGTRRLDLSSMTIGGFGIGQFIFGGAHIVTNQFQWADQISWTHGKHTIRGGVEVDYHTRFYDFNALQIGGISISSFSDFLLGLPGCTPGDASCTPATPGNTNGTGFSNIGSTNNAVRPGIGGLLAHTPAWAVDSFIQDDFKMTRHLTLNLGLRWEYFGYLSEDNGKLTNQWVSLVRSVPFPMVSAPCSGVFPAPCPGGTFAGNVIPANFDFATYGAVPPGVVQNIYNSALRTTAPLNNFAPRIGFAWQPFASNHFVVRGGAGVFYHEASADDLYIPDARQPPYAANRAASGQANFFSSLAQPFDPTPVGFVPRWYCATGTCAGQSSNILFPFLAETLPTPVAYQYNLNVQYEFLHNWVLEVGYVGSHAIHIFQPTSTDGVRFNPGQLAGPSNPVNCGFDGIIGDCVTSSTTDNVNLRVPYLGIATSDYVWGANESYKYNSLQATVRKQFSHGFSFQGAYTFSRAFLTTEQGVNSNYPIVQVYTPNSQYRPQRLTLEYSWDLPLGHRVGFAGRVTSGWTVSGVTSIQDGTPLTITDTRGGSIFGTPITSNAQFAAGWTGNVGTSGSVTDRVNSFINTAAFSAPLAATFAPGCVGTKCGTAFGNSGFGVVLGPGQDNWDIAVSKMTTVGGLREGATLQFRSEFFNAFNHPQFSNPPTTFSTLSTFGKITSMSVNPRLIQFAVKYSF